MGGVRERNEGVIWRGGYQGWEEATFRENLTGGGSEWV